MGKRILIGVLIAVVAVIVVVGAYFAYHYFIAPKTDTSQQAETEVPVRQGLGDIPEAPEIESGLGGLPETELGDRALETPVEVPFAEGDTTEATFPEGEFEADELTGDVTGPVVAGDITDIQSALPDERESRPATGTTGTRPGTTEPSQPSGFVAEVAEEQPTLTPSGTATPPSDTTTTITPPSDAETTQPTPTPGPAPGNYSVRTLSPVVESQLSAVRTAMNKLGARLKEQKTGQQHLQAYRLAVGYFRTKAEAESWAQYNFKPKGISYYIYPVQNMYSIQVGVYSHPQNVEVAMRELYRRFPGWRLPVRREVATITRATYSLSITRISKSVAYSIQRELNRLGVQAEITGT